MWAAPKTNVFAGTRERSAVFPRITETSNSVTSVVRFQPFNKYGHLSATPRQIIRRAARGELNDKPSYVWPTKAAPPLAASLGPHNRRDA